MTEVKKNVKSGEYPSATITIGKGNINFVLDTGATVNLIDESDYRRLKDVKLKKTSTKLSQLPKPIEEYRSIYENKLNQNFKRWKMMILLNG